MPICNNNIYSMNKQILKLAIPSIVTNITVPLLGMVDVAIVGHIGDASYIAAIALATMVFNLIYWGFGFLRAGTSGLTAQAYGAEDKAEYLHVLVRGTAIALSVALMLILLQWPIGLLCKKLIHSSPQSIELMLTYFYIRIWAAPATLGLYVFKGWFIGMQNAKTPMWIAILLNIVNIICSLLFVIVFHAGIAGVAWGTVIAELIQNCLNTGRLTGTAVTEKKDVIRFSSRHKRLRIVNKKFFQNRCIMNLLPAATLRKERVIWKSYPATTLVAH